MKARITKFCRLAPEGHTVIQLHPGDVCWGYTAQLAIEKGCAELIKEPELETAKPPKLETKRDRNAPH